MIDYLNLPIQINHYIILSSVIFFLGVAGIFLNRKNVINILMSIELILLGVNINFISFSFYSNDLTGQVFSLFILTVAAAEAAIGLAILVVYFRNKGSIDVKDINVLKG
ncbi:MAG: NADH-quinone oxidoreductase subunit NuoK [SAR116 cluster bacterium]|nr:NADH-quinone oxidoreductase subunit NuoK [SAR116 cluster bacterium]RPH08486.1 MAG: NADH-quinone oxidoreductase subunit NuoK [Alphaproteobacteria bacterium TMED54]|tara:strand:- start:512 stop:838 length:327 start_codon:yes stop_codon:yes gene_type:complete